MRGLRSLIFMLVLTAGLALGLTGATGAMAGVQQDGEGYMYILEPGDLQVLVCVVDDDYGHKLVASREQGDTGPQYVVRLVEGARSAGEGCMPRVSGEYIWKGHCIMGGPSPVTELVVFLSDEDGFNKGKTINLAPLSEDGAGYLLTVGPKQ